MMASFTIWMRTLAVKSALAAEPDGTGPAGPSQPMGLPTGDGNAPRMTDIHDIKPILAVGHDWYWLYWILGLLVLLALLVLGWRLWRRHRRPETVLPAPPVAPDAAAYDALDALAAENGLAPKQFYFRLSAILRCYIEARYEFPAAEMTTEELLPQVAHLPLEAPLAGGLTDFCRFADPVKFADGAAGQERLAHDLAFARDFVRQTTVVPPAAAQDQPTASSGAASPTNNPAIGIEPKSGVD